MRGVILSALSMMEDIKRNTDEKIEEARALYWEACKYPRKKKKAIRKKAKKDFIFWSNLKAFNEQTFSF